LKERRWGRVPVQVHRRSEELVITNSRGRGGEFIWPSHIRVMKSGLSVAILSFYLPTYRETKSLDGVGSDARSLHITLYTKRGHTLFSLSLSLNQPSGQPFEPIPLKHTLLKHDLLKANPPRIASAHP
jgi:hypothetical protein